MKRIERVAVITLYIAVSLIPAGSSKAAWRSGSVNRNGQKSDAAFRAQAVFHSGLSENPIIACGNGELSVSWKLEESDDIAGFEVLRKTPGSGYFYQVNVLVARDSRGWFGFTDKKLDRSRRYIYKVEARRDKGGSYPLFITDPVAGGAPPVELLQNRPNPFNPSTVISYSVRERTRIILEVFDARGKRVAGILDKERGPGEYSAVWNGFTDSGRMAASGVYFCRLRSDGFELTRRMVLLR